jgi:hypothetical protein
VREGTLTSVVPPATETLAGAVALMIDALLNVPLVMEILANVVPSRNVLPATVILAKGVPMTAAPLVISTRMYRSKRPNSDDCLVFLNP